MLEIYRGDSKDINLTFTNTDGTPFVLSGYSLAFTAKSSYSATGSAITVCQTGYVSAVSGMMSIHLTTGQTNINPGDYYAQFALFDSISGKSTYNTDGLRILPSLNPITCHA